jgi:hypothetical protein
MPTLQDYIDQVQILVHDQTNQDFSAPDLANAINQARLSVALDFHCIRSLYICPPANAPNSSLYRPVGMVTGQEAYVINSLTQPGANALNGQVVGANVLTGGTGYPANTTVTFATAPAGGVTATGVPVIAGGVVTGINMTRWGSGYTPSLTTTPAVTIAGAGGVGATATATVFNNVYNVLNISYIWGNQRYMLRYRSFTLFQAYLRSQLFFLSRGLIFTVHQESGVVFVQPPPDQPYVAEWDVLSTPVPLVATTDFDTQITPPNSDAVQFYAAMILLTKLQNFEQAEYMQQKYDKRVPKIVIGYNGIRIPNPYNRSFQRKMQRG